MENTRNTCNFWFFLKIANVIATGLFFFGSAAGGLVNAAPAPSRTVQIWLQTTDSCQQAVPKAIFILHDNGTDIVSKPGPGKGPKTIAHTHGNCPTQQGNCATISVGCVSWLIATPVSGTRTVTITEKQPASSYAICLGGSDCPYGTNIVTVKIDSTGRVSATDLNTYPNGFKKTFPTNRAAFAGTQKDPILVHNSRIGNGDCDGDHDADDHVTGTEGKKATCDSDHDKVTTKKKTH